MYYYLVFMELDMPIYSEFLSDLSKNKDSTGYYLQLNKISQEERKNLARELIANRYSYDFRDMITQLSHLCFDAKGVRFIREGSSDILGDILAEYTKQLDGDKLDISNSIESIFSQYQADDEIAEVFQLIDGIARQKAHEHDDENYFKNLPQNICNKVYNGILVDKISSNSSQLKKIGDLQAWLKSDSIFVFYTTIINQKLSSQSTYNDNKALANENATQTIDAIKTEVERQFANNSFKVSGFLMYKGGVNLEIGGTTKRVPHRVKEMYDMLNQTDKAPTMALKEVQDKAQDAIDNPRKGRKQGTTDFYQRVVDNNTIEPHQEALDMLR
jgi:hypothetical protein